MPRIQPHTMRLTFVFLSIIMCMSLAFSFVIYDATAIQLEKQLPAGGFIDADGVFGPTDRVQQYLGDRIRIGKQEILLRLIILNGAVLVIGAGASFLLARRMLRPIEDVMEAQAQFVSDASHELRTPLTAIQTTNEVTLRTKNLTAREAKRVIKSNLDDVARLQRMTTMLLELANRDVTLDLVPTDIHDIVSIALTSSASKAESRHISIDDQTKPEWVVVDPDAAAQALTAIIDNAIKYSPDDSTITLTTTPMRHGLMRLSVSDRGPGIAANDLDRVFDRFYRSDNARSRQGHEGYGLGLAIAKQIMKLHGGTIHVDSKVGEGSTFMLDFLAAKKKPTR